jgi:hypothetical protein
MQDSIAKRFTRTLKEEHVNNADSTDFDDALAKITDWLQVEYNTRRIHSAPGYATPAEFEPAHVRRPSQVDALSVQFFARITFWRTRYNVQSSFHSHPKHWLPWKESLCLMKR